MPAQLVLHENICPCGRVDQGKELVLSHRHLARIGGLAFEMVLEVADDEIVKRRVYHASPAFLSVCVMPPSCR
jgi:hypothetical protein